MPDYTQDPTGDDFKTWLKATGLVKDTLSGALANLDFDQVVAASVEEWMAATNFSIAFLSSGTTRTIAYDVQGDDGVDSQGELKLVSGAVSVSAVRVGGVTLTEGTDYILLPRNAPEKGKPYTGIKFITRLSYAGCGYGAIEVDAIVGHGMVWPKRPWLAVMYRCALHQSTQLALKISGGRASLKADDVSLEFRRSRGGTGADGPLAGESEFWKSEWTKAVISYRI